MKRRIFTFILVAIMLASIFAGCSQSDPQPADADNNEKVEDSDNSENAIEKLTVAMALSEEEWRVMRDIVFVDFEKEYGIEVEGIQVEHGDMESKLSALKAANKVEIDLVAPDNMLLYPLVEKGLVKDLSKYEENIPSEVTKNLYEDFKFDGKLYFMPFRPNVQINFYNENKLNEYNLEPPRNWNEFYGFAKTLHEKEGIGRVGIQATLGAPTTVTIFEFIKQAGGDPLVLNDEGSVAAYTYLKKLWPYLSPESKRANFSVMNQILANEAIYYGSNWPFAANVIVKDGGKTEIKAHVGFEGPERISKVLGGNVLAIVEGTPAEAEAMKFIEFILSKEVQEKIVTNIGWPSARNDAYGSIEEWQKPYFEQVNEAMKYAEPRPVVNYWSEVDKAINEAFTQIVIEGADVKATLDKYHDVLEEARAAAQ